MSILSRKQIAPVALALLPILLAVPASAQARAPLERNTPPILSSGGGGIVIGPQDLAGSPDDTPLGVDIAGIVLVGPAEAVPTRPVRGVRIGEIGDIAAASLTTALDPFLGQPLSRQRITTIQAVIAKAYRAAGYPLVSVTVPPQEVTGGTLALRVVEFRSGGVKVSGAATNAEADIVRRVRMAQGERISVEALDEDFAWLNLNPYRSVAGVFAPGNSLGLSTLTLEVTPQKPWQVFGGWSNTGTQTTGYDRYFVGFGAALPGVPESFVSYQLTGSNDFWSDPGSVGSGPDQPNYYSQAARFVISTGARQSLEFVPNYVATRQTGTEDLFDFDETTFEIPVTYRTAISNLVPGLYAGDLILGASATTLSRTSYFDSIGIGDAAAELFDLSIGWSIERSDALGATSVDLRFVTNPGGVMGGNNDTAWTAFSAGRVTDVSYSYGLVDISRTTRLPLGLSWVSQFNGLIAGQALPDTEQLALGGLYATRGYTLDDGAADTGLVWRNEVHAPVALLSALGVKDVADTLSPFAFFDVGWGRAYGYEGWLGTVPDQDFTLAGVGLGLDYQLARNFSASLVGGVALSDAAYTEAGDVNVQGRIFVSY
ncbi:MAG: ShlB/FhaC/HecB family hemolysin secretion/activation protein [Rhizobiales bacterium]|nr:ShlB/FhaC/HecB family hemolysin secretion/activation protein [Hyphomicrobiales bacterium]